MAYSGIVTFINEAVAVPMVRARPSIEAGLLDKARPAIGARATVEARLTVISREISVITGCFPKIFAVLDFRFFWTPTGNRIH